MEGEGGRGNTRPKKAFSNCWTAPNMAVSLNRHNISMCAFAHTKMYVYDQWEITFKIVPVKFQGHTFTMQARWAGSPPQMFEWGGGQRGEGGLWVLHQNVLFLSFKF